MRIVSGILGLMLLGSAAMAWEIVLPEQPTAVEQTAARELEHYLKASVGDTLKTATGEEAVFFIGNGDAARNAGIDVAGMPEESWIVRSSGSNILLVGGGSRGSLYAVYHFLEDVLGIHWWTQQEESVPAHPAGFTLPGLELAGQPYFRQRDIYRSWNNMIPDGGRFAARNRLNRDGDQAIGAEFGGSVTYGAPYFVHTFDPYFPQEKYFAEHPEYYALRNGVRTPGPTSQLCLVNPAMRDEMFRRLQEFIRADEAQAEAGGTPPPLIYDLSANDARNPCQCADCQAIVLREDSEAGPLLECVNDMAARLKAFRPELMLSTLAYYHTEKVPASLRAADNVIIRLCDTATNQAQSFSAPENRAFLELLCGWSEHAAQLGIWDYSITYMLPTGPFPHEFTLAENIRTYQDNQVQYLFFEHESPECADMHALNVWLEAKLMENPDADFDALYRTFLQGYYGAAAPMIDAYRQLLRESVNRHGSNIGWFAGPSAFTHVDYPVALRSQQLFDDAEAAVAGDPVLFERVRRARLNLDRICSLNLRRLIAGYVELTGGTPESCPLQRDIIAKRAHDTWTQAIRTIVDPAKQAHYQQQANVEYELVSGMEYTPFRAPSKFAGQDYIDLPADQSQLYGGLRVVSDADAEAGCAVKVPRDNELPLAGAMYVPLTEQTSGGRSIAAAEVPGPGYHWYKVADIRPQPSAYVYFTRDWTVQFPLNAVVADAVGDDVCELWVSVKFTGPAYPFGKPDDGNAVWIERIVLKKR